MKRSILALSTALLTLAGSLACSSKTPDETAHRRTVSPWDGRYVGYASGGPATLGLRSGDFELSKTKVAYGQRETQILLTGTYTVAEGSISLKVDETVPSNEHQELLIAKFSSDKETVTLDGVELKRTESFH